MKISFQKQRGYPSLGIEYFWQMKLEATDASLIIDHFIPEIFYDFLFIKSGDILCSGFKAKRRALPPQSLKTLQTNTLKLTYKTPLVLFGARLSLAFAEVYWREWLPANAFLEEQWVSADVQDLSAFAAQVVETVQKRHRRKTSGRMLSGGFEESPWLAHYSQRHKRRLYKKVYGISKKELQTLRNIHLFLSQGCVFDPKSPRVLHYLNSELFFDQPHLNNTFKKWTGFSPVEFFEAPSLLQDNLMSVSYNEKSTKADRI